MLRIIGWERITHGRGARFGRRPEAAATRETQSRYGGLAHMAGILVTPLLALWMILAN